MGGRDGRSLGDGEDGSWVERRAGARGEVQMEVMGCWLGDVVVGRRVECPRRSWFVEGYGRGKYVVEGLQCWEWFTFAVCQNNSCVLLLGRIGLRSRLTIL